MLSFGCWLKIYQVGHRTLELKAIIAKGMRLTIGGRDEGLL